MTKTNEHKLPFLSPRKADKYPDANDVYGTLSAIEIINEKVPEGQVQDRIPDYVCKAILELFRSLPHPDDPENLKRVTPDLLLKMFGPITARALVIAATYTAEKGLRKCLSFRDPSDIPRFDTRWRFVAKELDLALPWNMWIEGSG